MLFLAQDYAVVFSECITNLKERKAVMDTWNARSKARLDVIKAKYPDNWEEIIKQERTGKLSDERMAEIEAKKAKS